MYFAVHKQRSGFHRVRREPERGRQVVACSSRKNTQYNVTRCLEGIQKALKSSVTSKGQNLARTLCRGLACLHGKIFRVCRNMEFCVPVVPLCESEQ